MKPHMTSGARWALSLRQAVQVGALSPAAPSGQTARTARKGAQVSERERMQPLG